MYPQVGNCKRESHWFYDHGNFVTLRMKNNTNVWENFNLKFLISEIETNSCENGNWFCLNGGSCAGGKRCKCLPGFTGPHCGILLKYSSVFFCTENCINAELSNINVSCCI